MDNYCEITFDKTCDENLLVDFISAILKNLHHKRHFFFLDNVLIDKKEYNFIFGGNTKINYQNFLLKEILKYIKVKSYRCEQYYI